MAELLFIATTVFVAYVVFSVVGGKKTNPEAVKPITDIEPATPTAKPETPAAAAKPVAQAAAAPAKTKSKTKSKTTATKAPKTASAPAGDSLKNPKTGEVAKLPSNYAFTKRWIKEALVEEGLLEKIYKNNELDSNNTAKIQEALQQLKAMEKYQ